eukprot:scaffold117941_cov60-Attheya_sp.AAC.1
MPSNQGGIGSYACDYCGMSGFRSYEDAADHESQCSRKIRRPGNDQEFGGYEQHGMFPGGSDMHGTPKPVHRSPDPYFNRGGIPTPLQHAQSHQEIPSATPIVRRRLVQSHPSPAPASGGPILVMRPEEADAQQNRFRMSELDSLASQNLQAFSVTQEDATKAKSGNSNVIVGHVGIRCIHCHRNPVAADHATFPKNIALVGDGIRQIAERHFPYCTLTPTDIRDQMERSLTAEQQANMGTEEEEDRKMAITEYCLEFCRRVGIVNSGEGHIGIAFAHAHSQGGGGDMTTPVAMNRQGGSPDHMVPQGMVAPTPLVRRTKPEQLKTPIQDQPIDTGEPEAFNSYSAQQGGEPHYPGYGPPPGGYGGPMYGYAPPISHPPNGEGENDRFQPLPQPPVPPPMPESPNRYLQPPSHGAPPYDLFPFFQDSYGSWLCRYCCTLPFQYRAPQSVWQAPTPPSPGFVDQHLSQCRPYNQPIPPIPSGPPMHPHPGMYQGPPHGHHGWGHQPPPYHSHPPSGSQPPSSPRRNQPPGLGFYPHMPHAPPRYGEPSVTPPRSKKIARDSSPQPEGTEAAVQRAIEYLKNAKTAAAEEGEEDLVLDEDKRLLTDYFYYLMKQLRPCRFSEADRKTRGGKRENVALGYGGLQCVHCLGATSSRKFFWSNVDRLANSFAEIPGHVLKCKGCPTACKRSLIELKGKHAEQMAKRERGSQKIFFRRMWRRLHPDDVGGDKNNTKQDEGSDSPQRISLGKSSDSQSPKGERNSYMQISRSTTDAARDLASPAIRKTDGSYNPVLLAIKEDRKWLSDTDCFIRRNLEVFCAIDEDVAIAQSDNKYPISVGQVGIRCVHCAAKEGVQANGAAVFYSFSVNGIYESVREFQRLHLESCPNIPESAKTRLASLNLLGSLSSVLRRYYVMSAKALGLYDATDTTHGVRSSGNHVPVTDEPDLESSGLTGTTGSFLEAGPPITPLESRKRKAPTSPEEKRGSSGLNSVLFSEGV